MDAGICCELYGFGTYTVETVLMCFKEFFAVLVQLVCFSRLGQVDLFNGGLVLYMVLVVFSFPFLNSYLYGFLRLGMWYVRHPDVARGVWWARTLLQFLFMTVFQVCGALAAAFVVKEYQKSWPDAVLHSMSDTTPASGEKYKSLGVLYQSYTAYYWMFAEEFCAVLILLVGMLHLMGSLSPDLMKNTYWGGDVVYQDSAPVHVASPINAIPSKLILYASILVAAISRAFPSAHQSLHLTVYFQRMGTCDQREVVERVCGGYVACLVALAYYYMWYVIAGREEGGCIKSDGLSAETFYAKQTRVYARGAQIAGVYADGGGSMCSSNLAIGLARLFSGDPVKMQQLVCLIRWFDKFQWLFV